MAIAEAAKIVFQTALASTLESKGFRRVSDTNYVLEGDGVEWRVVFGPEYSDDPGTFREESGIYLPEADTLYQQVFPNAGPFSLPIAGTKYRASFIHDILGGYNHSERNRGIVNPDFENVEPCIRRQKTSYDRREHWVTRGHDLKALGIRINRYWLEFVLPWLNLGRSKADLCRLPTTINLPHDFGSLIEAWVCGHKQAVIGEMRRRKEQANQSDEAVRKMLLARAKERYPKLHWLFQKPTEADVRHWQRINRKRTRNLERVAMILGITL